MKPCARFLLMVAFCLTTHSLLTGCELQQLEEAQRSIHSGSSSLVGATPTATPSCGDFTEYDSYLACQTATHANCLSEYQSLSNGGVALCYYPVPGWQYCSTSAAADWIYTPYTSTVCKKTTGPAGIHLKMRSVIGCSSAICACMGPQLTVADCDIAVGGDCPAPTPTPMPDCP